MVGEDSMLKALRDIDRRLTALLILTANADKDQDGKLVVLSRAGFSSTEISEIVGLHDRYIRKRVRGVRKSR